MVRYEVPQEMRPHVKRLLGDLRRARKLSVGEMAALVGISAKRLQDYEAPSGRMPPRPLVARIAYALQAPALLDCLYPHGWLTLGPVEVGMLTEAVRSGEAALVVKIVASLLRL